MGLINLVRSVKSRKKISRRDALVTAVEASAVGAIIARFALGPKEIDIRKADLSQYPATEWGKGSVTWEDIRTNSADGLIAKISTPSMALSWLRLLREYNRDVSAALEEKAKKALSGEEKTDAHLLVNILGGVFGFRSRFEGWHKELQAYASYKAVTQEFSLTTRDIANIRWLMEKNNPTGWEFDYDRFKLSLFGQDQKRYRVYAKLILMSDLSEQRKIAKLVLPESERMLFPYTSGIFAPGAIDDNKKFLQLVHSYADSPYERGTIAVCEDVSLSIMEMLKDDGYAPLVLAMAKDPGWAFWKNREGHIVYLVKGKEGYGYIGFNPDIHCSKPKFKSIRELMQKAFPKFDGCLVFDYEKSGLYGRLKNMKGVFKGENASLQKLVPVEEYTD